MAEKAWEQEWEVVGHSDPQSEAEREDAGVAPSWSSTVRSTERSWYALGTLVPFCP